MYAFPMQHPLLLVSWHHRMGFSHHVYLCRTGIDQTGNMNKYPPRVQELISTPTREEIFKIITTQQDGFTFHDVYTALKNENIEVSITSVQNLLKALSYRGYLKEYTLKKTKTPGRSTIHYKKKTSL